MTTEALAAEKATLQTVTQVQRWTESLFSFITTRPAGYRFAAGHYARLGLEIDGQIVWRAYSIVSSPDDDYLEYYGVIVPGGTFTSRLNKISPGDAIWMEKQSYGFMTPDRFIDGDELWMLATGTGLGPYISILRTPMVWERFRRLILVHCVKHADEFSYHDLLHAWTQHPPKGLTSPGRLQVIQTTTRDPGDASTIEGGRLHGRITTLLENGELEKAVGLNLSVESSRVMLCGNPAMIEDTRRILHERGMRPCRRAMSGQFVTENYW